MPICGCRWRGDDASGTLLAPAIRDIRCNHWPNYSRIRPFGMYGQGFSEVGQDREIRGGQTRRTPRKERLKPSAFALSARRVR